MSIEYKKFQLSTAYLRVKNSKCKIARMFQRVQ